jgi:type 1 glutamine amidotransferase
MSLALAGSALAQPPPPVAGPSALPGQPPRGYRDPSEGHKRVLFIGDVQTGASTAHDWSVSHAAAVLERIGRETGAYDLFIRSDEGLITKAKTYGSGPNYGPEAPHPAVGRNLDYFDAVVFYTNGPLQMSDAQEHDLLAFVHDDGKGFVGIHTATATLTQFPQYADMIGAHFDNHPWGITTAPVIVEEPKWAAMAPFKTGMTLTDEFYQMSDPYKRSEVDVLMRLDTRALDLTNKMVHRTDGDFPMAWTKTYGKGRVFYSPLGHPPAAWDDPRIQTLYLEAIKWALGETGGVPHPHPMTPP